MQNEYTSATMHSADSTYTRAKDDFVIVKLEVRLVFSVLDFDRPALDGACRVVLAWDVTADSEDVHVVAYATLEEPFREGFHVLAHIVTRKPSPCFV